MLELKRGDRCEIIAIGKKDAYYKSRKELIGKKFRFVGQYEDHRGGFIECDLKSETKIKLPKTSKKLVEKNETFLFFMVKLKKI